MENKRLSVFKALRDSVQNVLDNFAPFVVAFIKTFVFMIFSFAFICAIILLVGGAQLLLELKQMGAVAKTAIESGTTITAKNFQSMALAGFQFVFGHLLPFALAAIAVIISIGLITLAYTRFSLDLTDKKSSQFSIFSKANLKLIPTYFLANILFWFIVFIGLIAFVIPGVFFYLRFGLFNYFIVDQNAGVVESLKRSWRATSGYGWDMLVLYIIYWSMPNIGFLGILITASIGLLMLASAYRQLSMTVKPAHTASAFA